MPSNSFCMREVISKAIVEAVASSEKINELALVKKDYWIMHADFGGKMLTSLQGRTCIPDLKSRDGRQV